MREPSKWRAFWEGKFAEEVSDYQFDRGASPRPSDIEELSSAEFFEFVSPQRGERLLDAGCGTGENILRLHDRVHRIIAVDFSGQAIARCRRRVESHGISNVELHQSSVTELPIPDHSVDKIICMSVLHYLSDEEARGAFREFARVLVPGGTLILHAKNSSSLYLSTLLLAKRVKMLMGKTVKVENFRPLRWYCGELSAAGLRVMEYNSFNLVIIEGMPRLLVHLLQRLELRHYKHFPLTLKVMRGLGADLKLRAFLQ